jgi:hypothetical protein
MYCPACNGAMFLVEGSILRGWTDPGGLRHVDCRIGWSVACSACPVISEIGETERRPLLDLAPLTLEDLREPFTEEDEGACHLVFGSVPRRLHGRDS